MLKMAALRRAIVTVRVFIFIGFLCACTSNDVKTVSDSVLVAETEQVVMSSDPQQRSEERSDHGSETGEQQHWHETLTDRNEAAGDEEPLSDDSDPGLSDDPEDVSSYTAPPTKDQFQEELVIRPLHSGDIYASFQFQTLWDTDFLQKGKKGCIKPVILTL